MTWLARSVIVEQFRSAMLGRPAAIDHGKLVAARIVMDFIHILPDEQNAPSVAAVEILRIGRIIEGSVVEALAHVRNGQSDDLRIDLVLHSNTFLGIIAVAVLNSVNQRLVQGKTDKEQRIGVIALGRDNRQHLFSDTVYSGQLARNF